jgi:hypothetical protein
MGHRSEFIIIMSITLFTVLAQVLSARSAKSENQPTLNSSKILWNQYANDAMKRQPDRSSYIRRTLMKSPRVYISEEKSASLGLKNTIIISSYVWVGDNSPKDLFRSFSCALSRFGLAALLIVPFEAVLSDGLLDNIDTKHVTPVSYPDELFWKLLLKKSNNIKSSTRAKYSTTYSIPNFEEYGGLVKVVAVSEVLELGYNVIYLDADIVLLRDPIPFLLRGNADFTSALESRQCDIPHTPIRIRYGETIDAQKSAEPNTGVMHIRQSNRTINLFRTWTSVLIKRQIFCDQKAFPFWTIQEVSDCCSAGQTYFPVRYSGSKGFSVCYLSPTLFSNGFFMRRCIGSLYFRIVSHEIFNNRFTISPYSKWNDYSELYKFAAIEMRNFSGSEGLFILTPVAFHANYNRGSKENFLREFNIWPLSLNNSLCIRLNPSRIATHRLEGYKHLEEALRDDRYAFNQLNKSEYYSFSFKRRLVNDTYLVFQFNGSSLNEVSLTEISEIKNGYIVAKLISNDIIIAKPLLNRFYEFLNVESL